MSTRAALAAFTVALASASLLLATPSPAHADDSTAVIDKAIQALGGEANLAKVKAASWKSKNKIVFNGNENTGTGAVAFQGLDHYRQEFEGDFNGNHFKAVTLLNGDKGSRHFGDNNQDLDKEGLANAKRTVYLAVVPVTILPLKDKQFKVESIPDETVNGKPQAGVKVTAPDGKDFKLYFDKETGLPARLVAKVAGFMGDEFTQETSFSDYKEVGGIKKAMKTVSKRNGEPFREEQITEFTVVEKVDPKTFTDAG
jgi:hypothetical protein